MKKILVTLTAAVFVLGLGIAYAEDGMMKDKVAADTSFNLINTLDPSNAPVDTDVAEYAAEGSAAGGITLGPDSLIKSLDPSETIDNGPVKGAEGFHNDVYPW